MIRYRSLFLALLTIVLCSFSMELYADSLRFVLITDDGQVVAIPGKEFLSIVLIFLNFAGLTFALGFIIRMLRFRIL